MNSLILRGSTGSKDDFIHKFIEKENILPLNILRFDESLKISDARELKRRLSFASGEKEKRVVTLYAAPNNEAQNALLKTIEELSEDIFIIFFSEKDLLSTIISRCKVVKLGIPIMQSEAGDIEMISAGINRIDNVKDMASLMSLSESLFKEDRNWHSLILAFETIVKEMIEKNDKKMAMVLKILKAINRYSSLVEKNNLNKRLLFEKILLSSVVDSN